MMGFLIGFLMGGYPPPLRLGTGDPPMAANGSGNTIFILTQLQYYKCLQNFNNCKAGLKYPYLYWILSLWGG